MMAFFGLGKRERYLILHIDDSSLVLMATQAMLSGLGYDVVQADNGEAAISIALSQKPDLVLIDAMMPGIDGFETVRRMRLTKDLMDIPIIMVTGDDSIKSIDRATASGANDYLVKPVKEERLRNKLAVHLTKPLR